MDKNMYRIGIIAYLIFLTLSVFFYKERGLLLDNSLFQFEMMRNGTFTAPHSRYIAMLPQLFAFCAIKLSLSIKWVTLLFCFGYTFFHFACYIVTGGILNKKKLAIAMLVTNTLMVTHTFFWQMSELQLGVSLLFCVLALISGTDRKIPPFVYYLLLAIGMFFVGFSHPLIIFPVVFAFVFFWLNKEHHADRKQLVIGFVLFIVMYLCKKFFFTDDYEAGSSDVLKNIPSLISTFYKVYANKHFISNWVKIYYWLPILLAIITVVYVKRRRIFLLTVTLLSFLVYMEVINLAYPGEGVYDFYIENMYHPLCFILAVPFVFDILPVFRKNVTYLFVVLIVCTSFIRIVTVSRYYSSRVKWHREHLAKFEGQKVIVKSTEESNKALMMDWATPYETWLLSTIETEQTSSMVIRPDPQSINWAINTRNEFITTWGVFNYKDFNPVYFKFQDTISKYRIVE